MIKILEKPLSVNRVWQGKRFKTAIYKNYEQTLIYCLPKMEIPKGKLGLKVKFGFSSKKSDIDNPIKPLLDILQKRYGFDDSQIYKLNIEKVDVAKGKEFTEFEFII